MITKNIFRSLILMQWVILALYFLFLIFADSFGIKFIPDEIAVLADEISSLNSTSDYESYIFIGGFALYITSSIGMFFFLNWARYLNLIVVISFAIISLIQGDAVVDSSLDEFVGTLIDALDGVIIALSFYSNVSNLFTKTVSKNE